MFPDEVLQKIGRNLVLFQQVEALLKFLLVYGYFRGPATDAAVAYGQKQAALHRQTMGQLVGQMTDEFLSDAGEDRELPVDGQAGWMSFSFRMQGDSTVYEQERADMELMVSERNDLVHHFSQRWDQASAASMAAAAAALDVQHARIVSIRDRLKAFCDAMQRGRKALAEFMATDTAKRTLELLWLRGSPLVEVLREISVKACRPDGWMPLAAAGHLARQQLPEDIAAMSARYGHKTLKRLLLATELFDIQDEATEKGVRTIYRLLT
ncbi:MAG: hypothetical protein JWR07_5114 [Nevskia sp.]|nr:hypothetical protein [Nevskia sp.]